MFCVYVITPLHNAFSMRVLCVMYGGIDVIFQMDTGDEKVGRARRQKDPREGLQELVGRPRDRWGLIRALHNMPIHRFITKSCRFSAHCFCLLNVQGDLFSILSYIILCFLRAIELNCFNYIVDWKRRLK